MSRDVGVKMLNTAAAKGDVKMLHLLIKCAGLEANLGDLDGKRALHYAAEESRLLAVSYLISVAANPNVEDRWGNKPLDLALTGETIYHLYCARLLDGWGGRLGRSKNSETVLARFKEMREIDMDQVRERIESLLAKGYDLRAPVNFSRGAVSTQLETVHRIVEILQTENKMEDEIKMVQGMCATVLKTSQLLSDSFAPHLVNVPLKHGGQRGIQQELIELSRTIQDENIDHTDDFEDVYCAIDSDEEERLFEELDYLVDLQERAEAFKGDKIKFIANSFQRAFMTLTDHEIALRSVCEVFRSADQQGGEPIISDVENIHKGLAALGLPEASLFETEEMVEHSLNCARTLYGREVFTETATEFPVHCLLAGSDRFRQMILKLTTDPIYCALVKTHLVNYVSRTSIKELAKSARELEYSRVGKKVYSSLEGHSNWYVLLSGKLKATLESDDEISTVDITDNMIFGGYHAGDTGEHLTVEILQPSKLIELGWEALEALAEEDKKSSSMLMSILGSSCWKSLEEQQKLSNDLIQAETVKGNESSFRRLSSSSQGRLSTASQKSVNLTESELDDIKTAFTTINGIWTDMAVGLETVSYSLFESVRENVGEMGSELFIQIFMMDASSDRTEPVTKDEYWMRWMQYFATESYGAYQPENEDNTSETLSAVSAIEYGADPKVKRKTTAEKSRVVQCLDGLRSRFLPSRKLNDLFFSDQASERYESSYMAVVGDLKKPVPLAKLREFLELVFPSFPYPISVHNEKEALELFGRHGKKSTELYWSDIRKTLRERKGMGHITKALFIKNAFNPLSWHIHYWSIAMKMLAIYYFVSVPIRISFLPWENMVVRDELILDLTMDFLCALNVLILVNTAYKNSRAMWVTKRSKIVHKVPFGFFVAALPLDWFAHVCGASNQLSCWLRLPKLILMWTAFSKKAKMDAGQTTSERSGRQRMLNLASVVFGIIHIGACVWFYIGSQYQYWFPDAAISWYYIAQDTVFAAYHATTNSVDEALEHDSSVWTKYVLSFYWVSATITSNGTVGDVLPSNILEIIFTIVLMIFNLTLFRYVTGEVSSVFMKADEEVVNARAGLEALESFLKDKRLGKDLQESIRQHYKMSQAENFVDQTVVFSKMPHSLKMEVASYVAREYLDNVRLFQGCSEKLLDTLSVMLREVQFSPEEYLYRAGEMATEMFFIISGSVEEVSEIKKKGLSSEKVERVLSRGKGTGDLAFFFGTRHFVGARGSKLTGAVCMRLPREEFLALLEHFPDDEERIAQASMVSADIQSNHTRSRHSGSVAQRSSHSGSRSRSSGSQKSKSEKGDDASKADDKSEGVSNDQDSMAKSDSEEEKDDGSLNGNDALTQRVDILRAQRKAQRTKLILNAAARGDIVTLKQALKSESVNVSDPLKRTPLHVASSEGQVEVVKFLLKSGAEVNAEDAFRHTSLNDAVRHRHDAVAKLLRESGGRMVLEVHEGGQLLCQAARIGNMDELKRLIVNGVHPSTPDTNFRTALHIAASEGLKDMVEFLLESDADVNARDLKDLTPLDDAVRHRHVDVQKLIRSRGGALNVDVSTALMCQFAAKGDVESIRILVENGASCSARNHEMRTPAHLAASCGMISVLDFLILQGDQFEINAVDRMGGTPLEDAVRHGFRVATILLEENGGLRADDPRLPALRQEQHERIMREHRLRRALQVDKAVHESLEIKGWKLISENYVPGLRRAGTELEDSANKIEVPERSDVMHLARFRPASTPHAFDSMPRHQGTGPHSQCIRKFPEYPLFRSTPLDPARDRRRWRW